jgi:hypothetical protein
MTKRLEELFNLDEKENKKQSTAVEKPVREHTEVKSIEESYTEINKITKTLPQIAELDSLDEGELDKLATKAEEAYDDLMDLGMNVEVRYASRIFEVASSMLNNAINAKTAKLDKKLKAIDLQMKKYKIDRETPGEDPNDVINGQGYIITDRNELLKKLGAKE